MLPSPAPVQGGQASMRTALARLMFSSEARAFRRSGDPRFVRTRPFDTVQNTADNSLSLHFCSSWFKISFIVFSPLRDPAMEPFMATERQTRLSGRQGLRTEGDHPACTPEPSSGEGWGNGFDPLRS